MSARRCFPARIARLALMLAPSFAPASIGGDFPNPQARIEPEKRSTDWSFGVGVGYKRLEPAWAPADQQVDLVIVDATYHPQSWPLALALGIGTSGSAAVPRCAGVEAGFCGTFEVSAGVRGEWPEEARTRVFAGADLAVMGASATNTREISGIATPGYTPIYDAKSGTGLGARIEMGFTRPLGRTTRIGLRSAWSRARVSLFGRHLDPGGPQVDALVYWGR
jgi:hypothetical protein